MHTRTGFLHLHSHPLSLACLPPSPPCSPAFAFVRETATKNMSLCRMYMKVLPSMDFTGGALPASLAAITCRAQMRSACVWAGARCAARRRVGAHLHPEGVGRREGDVIAVQAVDDDLA